MPNLTVWENIEKILEKLMYKWLYTFLSNNNIIYNLQFGFRQQYSTSYTLINVTENIRKAPDDGKIGCGVFADLQKAFDTVDHQILFTKLITMRFVEFQMIGSNPICYGKPNVAKFNKIKTQYSIAKIQHSATKSHILLNFPFQKIQHSMMKD